MHKLIFCAVVLFFSTINAQKCQLTFKGKITDFHDNSTIVGATVHIINSNKYATSNLNGEFEFTNLCEGTFTVEFKHIACETKQIVIKLTKNIYKNITLEHHLEELKEVVVTSNIKTEKTSIEQTLKNEVITNFTDKSLGDALNTVSGVSSLNTGNTIVKPMIHGLHSSRLLIVNNNVRMFDQEWGDEHAPNVDINASARVDVIKGANTLKYGSDAIGGLILLRPNKYAIKDSIFGTTTTALNSNGLGGSTNFEIIKTHASGFYKKLQASYKRFGDFSAPNYNLTNTSLESINASFALGYNSYEMGFDAYYSYVNNEIAILESSHIGNVNDLVEAINSQEPRIVRDFSYQIDNPRQVIQHHLAKIQGFKRYQNFGKLNAQFDAQLNRRQEYDIRRGSLRDRPALDIQLFTTTLQTDLEIDYYENLSLNTGFLLRYQRNEAIVNTKATTLIPDYNKYEVGTFLIANYTIDETSEINAGLRYDFSSIDAQKWYFMSDWDTAYNYDILFPQFETGVTDGIQLETKPKFTFHNISSSLGYSKSFENDYNLLINYGLAQRMPNPSELFSDGLHHSAARIEIGFLTIDKEMANKFAISFERRNNNFGFSINPYYKQIDNFIQLIPVDTRTTIRGAFPVWEYNQVNARIFGVDIDINKKITDNFDYKGSLSLLRGDNLTESIPLIHMPSANFNSTITYKNDAFHELRLSIQQRTVLQQKRYPDYNFFTFNPTIQQQVFVDISSTPPSYTLFNFNSSIVLHPFKKGSIKLAFNIENLFNVSYRENLNRLRYFADELGRNFNINIKINY